MLCLWGIVQKCALTILALFYLVFSPSLALAESASIKFSAIVAKQCFMVIDDGQSQVSRESDKESLAKRTIHPRLKCNFPTQNVQPIQSFNIGVNDSRVIVNSVVAR